MRPNTLRVPAEQWVAHFVVRQQDGANSEAGTQGMKRTQGIKAKAQKMAFVDGTQNSNSALINGHVVV
jgi:hypothetical protein